MSGPARAVVAGLAYAVAVFLLGSAVGTIRILALEPEFGALDATALELPLMLGLAWLLSLSPSPVAAPFLRAQATAWSWA